MSSSSDDVIAPYIGKVKTWRDLPIEEKVWNKIGPISKIFFLSYLQSGDLEFAGRESGFKGKFALPNCIKYVNKLRKLITDSPVSDAISGAVSTLPELRMSARRIRASAIASRELNVALTANRDLAKLDGYLETNKSVVISGVVEHKHLARARERVEKRRLLVDEKSDIEGENLESEVVDV